MQKESEPIEYVRGFTEFLGCKIDLSKRSLIPRPETEFWTEKAINSMYHDFQSFQNRSIEVLDIFSGSGCIGIAVLKHIKNCEVVFLDKEEKCLEQIKINLKINASLIRANKGFTKRKRYVVVKSDVFSNIRGQFDCIFANPPYVATTKINKIQKSVLKYEPKLALLAGDDGLFYIREFLKEAKDYLNPEGRIFMEFSPEQKNQIEKLIKKFHYRSWEFNKDQYGKWRWVIVFK